MKRRQKAFGFAFILAMAYFLPTSSQANISETKEKDARFSFPPTVNVESGYAITIPFSLYNQGSSSIKSIEYSYEIDGKTATKTSPLRYEAQPGPYPVTTMLEFPPMAKEGSYNMTLKVLKLDEAENPTKDSTLSVLVNIFVNKPKHLPVTEEYTGTWCPNCPPGLIGLEIMNHKYPDDFIAMSYHCASYNYDIMEVMPRERFPDKNVAFPNTNIDRRYAKVDGYDLENNWKNASSNLSPAEITLNAQLDTIAKRISATANIKFPLAQKGLQYKLEFVLLADSLGTKHNGGAYYAFSQSSNIGGQYSKYPAEEAKIFTDGYSTVNGFTFNDVVLASSRVKRPDDGIDHYIMLPKDIESGQTIEESYSFDVSKIEPLSYPTKINLAEGLEDLKVVVLLIGEEYNKVGTTSDYIMNAAKTKPGKNAATPIRRISTSNKNTSSIHDAFGRKLQKMQKGLNIITHADGSTTKVLIP